MMPVEPASALTLDGNSLTIADLVRVARDPASRIVIAHGALDAVAQCRRIIDDAVGTYKSKYPSVTKDDLMYGVTSGFGEFKSIAVKPDDLITLQRNILLSHAAGVGDTSNWLDSANYFPSEIVRAAMLVRLNAFLCGHSGVRTDLVLTIQAMLNAGVVPLVPTKGSVGSSGDLCPLAHMFVVLLGSGYFYLVGREPAGDAVATTGESRVQWMIAGQPVTLLPARELWDQLQASGLAADAQHAVEAIRKLPVSNKEGLALTNGATFSAATLALALHDAEVLANTADISLAVTMEAMCARVRFLDEKIHKARGMVGQMNSAENIRALLEDTKLCEWTDAVQDAYSIRCSPQVHGASRDAIAYAKMVVTAEINAATDNPLFFPGHEPFGLAIRKSREVQKSRLVDANAFSAGNFHGQPLALAADFLGIGLAELANVAERRIQMLLDNNHNRQLPPNLIAMPGVDSGFMIAQYTAASLVSENKVLAHPASVDSIPTSANFEDHVSMATHAARKTRQVLENVAAVIAIELIVGVQAVDWRTCLLDASVKDFDSADFFAIDPNEKSQDEPGPGDAPEKVQARADHRFAEFQKAKPAGPSDRTMRSLGVGTRAAYQAIRQRVDPMHRDAIIEPMIRTVRVLIREGALVSAVNQSFAREGRPPLSAIRALS